MAYLSDRNASELRRIVKESIGRDVSMNEVQEVWRYVTKIVQMVWDIGRKPKPAPRFPQPGLFD